MSFDMLGCDLLRAFQRIWPVISDVTVALLWVLLDRVVGNPTPRLPPTRSQLTSLPSEVLLDISAYLNPTDMLSLRQARNRFLHEVFS